MTLQSTPTAIALTLSSPQQSANLRFQMLTIALTSPDRLIAPDDLTDLTLPSGIDTTGGVIITGRAPIWLYAYLVHELHPTAWVACFDPRLSGAVVVSTHSRQTQIGQVISLPRAIAQPRLGQALMVVGPPDSGKSVFSHALFTALLPDYPDIFLQRANWDGEGNWILELPETASEGDRETFKLFYKGIKSERFFTHHGQSILQLRRQKPLVIVDVGGKVDAAKMPVLEACSHYLIISSKPEAIDPWHEFCRDRGNLRPLAVINSTLDEVIQVHRQEPYLHMTSGPWIQGKTESVPDILLEHLRSTLLGGSR
ncbi:MAG: CRISPR-associated protein Csx3 [Cyanobacteria bacterium J069]|nr:MAG: CRISPR-associated protein Csx3 [Cyanobacteria bacterium J069]